MLIIDNFSIQVDDDAPAVTLTQLGLAEQSAFWEQATAVLKQQWPNMRLTAKKKSFRRMTAVHVGHESGMGSRGQFIVAKTAAKTIRLETAVPAR